MEGGWVEVVGVDSDGEAGSGGHGRRVSCSCLLVFIHDEALLTKAIALFFGQICDEPKPLIVSAGLCRKKRGGERQKS